MYTVPVASSRRLLFSLLPRVAFFVTDECTGAISIVFVMVFIGWSFPTFPQLSPFKILCSRVVFCTFIFSVRWGCWD